MNVGSRIFLHQEPADELSAATSSWIKNSSCAREPHHLQRLMSFSRSTSFLVSIMMKHFAACITSSRPLSLVLMWEPPKQPQKLRICELCCWMMYRCYVYRTLHHSRAYLIRHLKLSHGLYPGKKFNLLCAQDGCSLEFKSYCGFRRHLKLFHSDTELPSCSD